MEKHFTMTLLSILWLFLATSCITDSYDAERCDVDRMIRIQPEWVNTDPVNTDGPVEINVSSITRADYHYTSGRNGVQVDLPVGNYRLVGWEPADNISVSGETVTVATGSDGMALDPAIFAGGAADGQVHDVKTSQVIPLPMRQQTHQLIIRVRFQGQGSSLMEAANATLTGIALSRNINDGFSPVDGTARPSALTYGNIDYDFVENTDGLFIGTRRLIGIAGQVDQTIDLTVNFFEGFFRNDTINVTGATNGFHTEDIATPLYINLVYNIGIDLEMTIVDWSFGGEEWLDANLPNE